MNLKDAAEVALEALERSMEAGMTRIKVDQAIAALRQALAQPDNTPDSAKHSADSAESFCKQELHNLMSVAGRMALELECLLLDTENLSVVSKWWDTGIEALQAYRHYVWSVTHGKDGENFCDTHCVHTDHHPDCELSKPEQEPPSECRTEGEKRAYVFGWWKALEVNRKEWVGLTDEEIYEIEEDSKDFDYLIPHLFARAIEAKLKEKNGYS